MGPANQPGMLLSYTRTCTVSAPFGGVMLPRLANSRYWNGFPAVGGLPSSFSNGSLMTI